MRLSLPVIAFLLTAYPMFAGGAGRTEVALIVAKPVSVVFVQSLTGPVDEDSLRIGNLYRVKLRVLRVVEGRPVSNKILVVELVATHRESIPMNGQIFVLLRAEGGRLEPLYPSAWGVPSPLGCVEKGMVAGTTIEHRFRDSENVATYECTQI
jgi:hypothetical protein